MFDVHFWSRRISCHHHTVYSMEQCLFLKHLRKMKLIMVAFDAADVEDVMSEVQPFLGRLASDRVIATGNMRLKWRRKHRVVTPDGRLSVPPRYEWYGLDSVGAADPCYDALMRIPCAPGFELIMHADTHTWASEGVWREFQDRSKAEIRYVDRIPG